MSGPSQSPSIRLEITTFRDGPLAALGHNLRLSATVVPVNVSQESIRVDIDCQSIGVLGAVSDQASDLKPLPRQHRREILKIIRERVLRTQLHPKASFEGQIEGSWIIGQLRLLGRQQAVKLEVSYSQSGWHGQGRLKPSRWGIEPYSTFFGALRVRDDVLIECWVGDE